MENAIPVTKVTDRQWSQGEALRRHMRQYATETTTHGVAQLMKEGSKIRVIIFALALLAGTTFLTLAFVEALIGHSRGDSYMDIEVVQKEHLEIPSITMCSVSFYSRSAFERSLPEVNVTEMEDFLRFIRFGSAYYPTDTSGFHARTFGNMTVRESYDRLMSNNLNETFLYCAVFNQLTNCSDMIDFQHTNMGKCFTVNARQAVLDRGPLLATYPDRTGGASFIVDARPDDYLLVDEVMVGFYFLVHDVDEFPLMHGPLLFMGPGQVANVAVTKEVRKRLPPPYSEIQCVDDDTEVPYRAENAEGFPYSQSACFVDCKAQIVQSVCGCSEFTLHANLPECTIEQIFDCQRSETYVEEVSKCSSQCWPLCNEVVYKPTITSAPFPNDVGVRLAQENSFEANTLSEMQRRLFKVNFYFEAIAEDRRPSCVNAYIIRVVKIYPVK